MKKKDSYYKDKYDKAEKLLKAAKEHLDYCGYGDTWERECSLDLQKKLNNYFDNNSEIVEVINSLEHDDYKTTSIQHRGGSNA